MALTFLTCFHGPKVETSFSIMNNIITSGTSRLNITTLNALQTVMYHLLAEEKYFVDYFYKSDFLQELADMKSSSKSYEKEKSEKKKVMVTKLKNIKDLKEKILPEEKAKKCVLMLLLSRE
ncbi:hypothetical protein AVEN_207042-1 [Araneus ventricosus]|uniref:HAT C-terminal dimerisation domain-containing protein n=1 Tax=Araneus ventricosus TaxID=182803 RepID=A0A4Y2JZA9_ARAVE|nr:hypothetical protein AVEN_207042-1 [Araneus ventricosus]